MDSCSSAATVAVAPFSSALTLAPADSGGYRAELPRGWTVGGGKLHGGFLLALLTKAGLAGLAAHPVPHAVQDGGRPGIEPVAVSAEFLRAPEVGPAELATEVLKVGRTVSAVRVALRQHGRAAMVGTVTAGQLPEDPPSWSDLPTMAAGPPPGAPLTSDGPGRVPPMAHACQVVLDPATASFTRGERGTPLLRGWVRPVGEAPDVLFTLVAGDILPPLLFNLGRLGWAPTVQLTALLRGRPAPGWLRLEAASRTVRGDWLDEDYTVIDAEGRLVCQARQLALAPLDRPKS
jgi:acyl-coenzyme A thioesterase PaaI-like protein